MVAFVLLLGVFLIENSTPTVRTCRVMAVDRDTGG
jgi:hypothetical protein